MGELPAPAGGHRHIARLIGALSGSVVTSAADRGDAAAIEAAWPGTREQVTAAAGCHSRAAAWACGPGGARSLVVCPAGYPAWPWPHQAALDANPGLCVVLAEPDAEVAEVAGAVWGADDRVAVIRSAASDAAGLWRQVRGIPRPVCLLLPWVTGMLHPEAAEAMTEAYGTLLPAGSLLALTWWAPDGGPAGEAFTADWRQRGVRGHGHPADRVAGWLKAAGMELISDGEQDVRDVRVTAGTAWREEAFRHRSPGRMVCAVARVR